MRTKILSRYPGIRAFEKDEQHLFFGREEEAKRLYSQIKTQDLVVLFAKSGIGKSSLVNASILPQLNGGLFYPIKMRFQDTSSSPTEIFKQALAPYIDRQLLSRNHSDAENPNPWEYLRACRFEGEGKELMPVLILDQFEEFFDHPLEAQNELAVELADMIGHRLPNRIQEHLRTIPFMERTDEDLSWHSSIPVKILIAIRSDRIGFLDNLSAEIPSILQNRFQLKPLKQAAARHAIVEPALLEGSNYATPTFSYDAAVLEKILNGLSNSKGEIESFQLQLLCQFIEKQIQTNPPKKKSIVIKERFFKNENGFEAALNAILNNYYEDELNELSEKERIKARKFIEEGLIINGRRAGLTEGVEKERYQIEAELLDKLLNSRLIRQENTHLGKSYEISHDTLVAPILSSYEKRKSIEDEKQKAIARSKERKRLMSAFGLALLGFALAAVALVFYFQADQAKETALVERVKAEEALQLFKEKQLESINDRYMRDISRGESFALQNEFSEAIGAYEAALRTLDDFEKEVGTEAVQNIDGRGETARAKIKEIKSKESRQADFIRFIEEGEDLEAKGRMYLLAARDKYKAAENLDYDDLQVREKLSQISGKLDASFAKYFQDGDIYFKALGYDLALESYRNALRIRPGNQELREKIKNCQALLK